MRVRWSLLFLLLLVGALCLTQPIRRIEWWSVDRRLAIRGIRHTKSKVAVVALDDRCEKAWTEPVAFWGTHLADLVQSCRNEGASVVALDFFPSDDSDGFLDQVAPEYPDRPNSELAAILIRNEGHVVMARTLGAVPLPSLTDAVDGQVGLAEVCPVDVVSDNEVRTVTAPISAGSSVYESFSILAARAAGAKPSGLFAASPVPWDPDLAAAPPAPWLINYVGVPPPTYSALDVPARLPAGALKGKVVVIGLTFQQSGDQHQVPGQGLVPGVEVQAAAISTILDNRPLRATPQWLFPFVAMAACIVGLMCSLRWNWPVASAVLALALGLYSELCILQTRSDLLLPWIPVVVGGIGGLLLGYTVRGVDAERAFGVHVSPKVRDAILASTGSMHTKPVRRIRATVLFVDIRGFVSLGDRLGPEALVQQLNEFMTGAIAAVEAADGFVSAFTGDGFLAVFGAFDESKAPTDRSWDAARGMKSFLDGLNQRRGGEVWRIGIGIHDGELVCAYVGAKDRCTFTVMGDVVNVAARLQDTTKEQECTFAISENAWNEMTSWPADDRCVEVKIRGKDLPMRVHYV